MADVGWPLRCCRHSTDGLHHMFVKPEGAVLHHVYVVHNGWGVAAPVHRQQAYCHTASSASLLLVCVLHILHARLLRCSARRQRCILLSLLVAGGDNAR